MIKTKVNSKRMQLNKFKGYKIKEMILSLVILPIWNLETQLKASQKLLHLTFIFLN